MLLLAGGVSLGVLLVIGAFLYMSLTKGAAEDMIGAAETAYGKESYTEAIRLYDDYLKAHPRHEKASRARVFREIARLRQVYRTPDQGLKVAQEAAARIKKEESFPDAREELASILPQIARGFVDAARVAKETSAQASTPGQGRRSDEVGQQHGIRHIRASEDTAGVDRRDHGRHGPRAAGNRPRR